MGGGGDPKSNSYVSKPANPCTVPDWVCGVIKSETKPNKSNVNVLPLGHQTLVQCKCVGYTITGGQEGWDKNRGGCLCVRGGGGGGGGFAIYHFPRLRSLVVNIPNGVDGS